MELIKDISRERWNRILPHERPERIEKLSKRHASKSRYSKPANNNSKEMVTKLISKGKSIRSINRMMCYLSRDGEQKIFDERGKEITDFQEYIEAGKYIPDHENISKKCRELSSAARSEFPEKERLHQNQVLHFCLSFHYQEKDLSDKALHKIAQEFGETFGKDERRFSYTIHRDKDRPHIHYLIDSKDEGGKQIRINREGLQEIRKIASEICVANGLNYVARDMRERTSQEREQAIEVQEAWDRKNKRKTLLERQAPNFFYVQKRNILKILLGKLGTTFENKGIKSEIELPKIAEPSQKELKRWSKNFKNPEIAEEMFCTLYSESPKTAFYYGNNRPDMFGSHNGEKVIIRKKYFVPSKDWMDESKKIIKATYDRPIDNAKNREIAQLEEILDMTRTIKSEKKIINKEQAIERELQRLKIKKQKPEPEPEQAQRLEIKKQEPEQAPKFGTPEFEKLLKEQVIKKMKRQGNWRQRNQQQDRER